MRVGSGGGLGSGLGAPNGGRSARCIVALVLAVIWGCRRREAVDQLVQQLGARDPQVRVSAALKLAYKTGPEGRRRLLDALHAGDAMVRVEAAFCLSHCRGIVDVDDAALVQVLVGLLRDASASVRRLAINTLWTCFSGHEVIQGVAASASDPDPDVRLEVCLGLGHKGVSDPIVITALERCLEDSCADVRCAAADALGKLGQAKRASGALVRMLGDRDVRTRLCALKVISVVGAEALEAEQLSVLACALEDPDATVRSAAAVALGEIGEKAFLHVDELVCAMGDPDSEARSAALSALIRLAGRGSDSARSAVRAILEQGDEPTRLQAIWAIGDLGPAGKFAVGDLERLGTESSKAVREAANAVVESIGNGG